ncbi:Pseudouridine synthase TruD, eukaryotic [Metarhizium album ARSEF 1941]|uniref:Pseudouridine synthase TruD, eukaryotic n=1 Tax=Metarhizium album (strain ARSEF 1941) TaxID=1081103 RepID=A0A0B2WZK2_METAS|nr:Pseudouridine synthase TruD, eukaryotic [Metarhizium album ARSEF 1941]KHN99483.1 Pseudouridine synthase TruD, eukaryotic [Metarhizium album ARSEF 1941]
MLQQPQQPQSQDGSSNTQNEAPGSSRQDGKPHTEPTTVEIPDQDIRVLQDLSTAQFAQDLVKLFNQGNGPSPNDSSTATSPALDDKSKRAQLHQHVRRIFKSRLDTTTGHDGVVVASFVSPRNGKKSRGRRGQPGDDEQMGEYLHFTLYKDNRDTMDAANQIARLLRMRPQTIGYAGTKDRRASTTQRCSVRHQRKRALAGLNDKLRGISTGDYEYREEPIHLGQLFGNEFVITLKNCKMADETGTQPPSERLASMRNNVESALKHMSSHGWINYFGHQRFGTHDVGTHQVGKLILGGDFEAAVSALLKYDPEIAAKAEAGQLPEEPSKKDDALRHLACMLFQTGKDLNRAAKVIPRRFAAESCILRHLTRMGKSSTRDFAGAITHITRGLRSMYLHAYQSHVWNHAASQRYALHGTKVTKGDLVISERESQPAVAEHDQDGDKIINPLEDEQDDAPLRARPLTEEEAASGKYTVYDIVLPSPGYDVAYPDNEIGKFYQEFMGRQENGSLDPHNMRRLRREFSLPGRYRKLMQRFLGDPSVEFKLYGDDTEQMHPTDVDLISGPRRNGIQGKRKKRDDDEDDPGKRIKGNGQDQTEAEMEEAKSEQDATCNSVDAMTETEPPPESFKIAVVLKFQLASSAYATVALRELMGDRSDEATPSDQS